MVDPVSGIVDPRGSLWRSRDLVGRKTGVFLAHPSHPFGYGALQGEQRHRAEAPREKGQAHTKYVALRSLSRSSIPIARFGVPVAARGWAGQG